MAKPSESAVPVLCLVVICCLIVVTLVFFWCILFDPYDTSASLNPPSLGDRSPPSGRPIRWPRIGAAIERSVVWDGLYFVRIAVCRLSILILKDSAAAFRARVLFCFNPASIFYSSVYSESLCALSSLGGLFYLFAGANTIAMILLALSGATRSNGAINAGYFYFQAILQVYDAIIWKMRHRLAVQAAVVGVACSIFIFVPFMLFQVYGYWNICHGDVPDKLRPWCKARVPFLYGFLQSHYWLLHLSETIVLPPYIGVMMPLSEYGVFVSTPTCSQTSYPRGTYRGISKPILCLLGSGLQASHHFSGALHSSQCVGGHCHPCLGAKGRAFQSKILLEIYLP